MKTAGVVIESWKLAIFKRHLDAAEFEYDENPGIIKDTILLRVKTPFVAKLLPVIEAALSECRKQ
jgi:hypothetical protein